MIGLLHMHFDKHTWLWNCDSHRVVEQLPHIVFGLGAWSFCNPCCHLWTAGYSYVYIQ